MPSDSLHEPWLSFLRELDRQLASPTELQCLGGFVVARAHQLERVELPYRGFEFLLPGDAVDLGGNPLAVHDAVGPRLLFRREEREREDEGKPVLMFHRYLTTSCGYPV